eukprot:4359244-Prymnesium_polylepis.1
MQGAGEHVTLRLLAVEPVAEPRLDLVGLELVVPALHPELVDRALRELTTRALMKGAGAPTVCNLAIDYLVLGVREC